MFGGVGARNEVRLLKEQRVTLRLPADLLTEINRIGREAGHGESAAIRILLWEQVEAVKARKSKPRG